MRIRDSHASVQGDDSVHTMPSGGLEIVGDDGRALYSLKLINGQLQVLVGGTCKHDGVVLDGKLAIFPHSSNCCFIERSKYERN